jgi:transposase
LPANVIPRQTSRPYRDIRCKESQETIRGALVGNYQPEHLFALKQALALYDFYQRCIEECDAEIERTVAALNLDRPIPEAPLPKPKYRSKMPSDPGFDVRQALYQLTGTDLTQIHGIGSLPCLALVGECGTDLSRWPTAKHFTSWLTLSPGCKISGGKVLSAHTRKTSKPGDRSAPAGSGHGGEKPYRPWAPSTDVLPPALATPRQ